MVTDALVPATVTPMELLQSAINQNLDIDKLSKLLELQLRWEANEARKAYVEAMNQFKSNPPTITKNKHVKFGNTQYDHATLDNVCDAVTQSLSEHGISHRWRIDEDRPDWIKVTCILTHKFGHSEETSQGGPPDNSGSKSPIQERASTVTYLQRYTLLAAIGMAASNDTDGAPATQLPEDAVKAIEAATTFEALDKAFKAAFAKADQKQKEQLIALKDRRRGEMRQSTQGVPLEWGKK